jgi:hypothetical protein
MAKALRLVDGTENLISESNSQSFDADSEIISLESGDHAISNQGDGDSVWIAEQDLESVDIVQTEIAPGEARTFNIATARSVAILKGLEAIYGARWDKGATPALTRTDDAVGLTAEAGVDAGVVTNDFDSEDIFGEITEETDTYGNVFCRIPKLYIRKVDGASYKSCQVSKNRLPGSYLPWCFWDFDASAELDYVDIGKHKATSDGGGTPKLESKPDLYPLVSQNIVTFRTYAQANNTGGLEGYQLLDIHAIDVLQTLMTVEFATLNMQSVMYGFGAGRYGIETELATADTVADNYIVVSNATAANYRVGQTISVGTARYGTQVFYGRTITAIDADTPGAGSTTITFDGDPVSISTGAFLQNTGWKNGFSSAIAASSGSIISNSDGKYPCVYRGIESPYADLWQFVDGLNIDGGSTWVTATPYSEGDIVIGTTTTETYRCTSGHTSDADKRPSTGADWADYWELYSHRQAWVCADADDYASNLFAAPYEQLGYLNHDVNNYVQQMGWDASNPFAALPVSVHTSSTQYYCDYYYQATGPRVARFGGRWFNGASCGPWSWYLSYSSTSALVSIGSRLLKKAL